MGFAIETQEAKRQERAVRGHYQKVAVGCWFTSTGRSIPQKLKFEDEEGIRHVVDNIQVIKSDQKHYAGILAQRYDCRAVIHGISREFILLYHPGENTWDMVLPDNL